MFFNILPFLNCGKSSIVIRSPSCSAPSITLKSFRIISSFTNFHFPLSSFSASKKILNLNSPFWQNLSRWNLSILYPREIIFGIPKYGFLSFLYGFLFSSSYGSPFFLFSSFSLNHFSDFSTLSLSQSSFAFIKS